MEYVIYTTLGTSVINVILTIFQSIKQDHFTSTCGGGKCCTMKNDLVMQEITKVMELDKKREDFIPN